MPLIASNNWILHRNKIPVRPDTLQPHDPHDVAIHTDYRTASIQAQLLGCELGFVLTDNNPYWCLDIDGALQADGSWSALALELVNATSGCLVEVSRSGKGLHIWGCGEVPSDRMCKNTALHIELYTTDRFIAWTGNVGAGGNEDTIIDLTPIAEKYFPVGVVGNGAIEWVDSPIGAIPDDDALIAKMLGTVSVTGAFGGKCSVADIWNKTEAAMLQYAGDDSSLDQALCMHLAFWTQKNPVRMERLFNRSGLVREKWIKREPYRRSTITNAVLMTDKCYKESVVAHDVTEVINGVVERSGYQFMDHTAQTDYFKGCTYIKELQTVLTPNGSMLKPMAFKSSYGGYVFALDAIGDKTSKNAFEVFTESQAWFFPKADRISFAPDKPSGVVYKQGGYHYVNAYVPIDTPKIKGDASRFTDHIKTLLPHGRDADILLSFMAACIQHKGVKFQWSPVIQGTEGNGKTLVARIMRECLGDRYCIVPNSTEIASKFNGWIENKLFCFIDEIKIPSHRGEVLEALKPIITNEQIAIERKGVDTYNGDNRANIIMATNHKDAIPVNVDQRRYAILYTNQQSKKDMMRDGWNAQYFMNLYDWLKEGGYAVVHDYLSSYVIADELNPATACQQAPRTSSTDEAIEHTQGEVEQEIQEAINSGILGFRGGFVSGFHLDRLLIERKLDKKVKRNKRRGIMQSLGYDYLKGTEHINGRVSRNLETDGHTRPVLFVKNDQLNDLSISEVTDLYVSNQNSKVNLFAIT